MEKYRIKVTPIVYLMLTKENDILLLRRYNTGFHDGLYSFPAGHVEQGEGLIQAVIREGREEIGIESKLEDLNLVHVMHLDGERIGFLFRTEKWEGEPKIMEPDKCDNVAWFSMDKLPDNIVPYIKEAINCIKNKRFYSEYGR